MLEEGSLEKWGLLSHRAYARFGKEFLGKGNTKKKWGHVPSRITLPAAGPRTAGRKATKPAPGLSRPVPVPPRRPDHPPDLLEGDPPEILVLGHVGHEDEDQGPLEGPPVGEPSSERAKKSHARLLVCRPLVPWPSEGGRHTLPGIGLMAGSTGVSSVEIGPF